MTKVLAPSGITGSFDATTEQAVKDFQQGAGLTVDGIVGPQTWQALPRDPNTPTLSRGASGDAVTGLQKGLKTYSTPATDPGAVDGDFGPKTEAAVKAYQQDRGVQADGIVGDQTWWAPAGAAGATLASLSGLTTVRFERGLRPHSATATTANGVPIRHSRADRRMPGIAAR